MFQFVWRFNMKDYLKKLIARKKEEVKNLMKRLNRKLNQQILD